MNAFTCPLTKFSLATDPERDLKPGEKPAFSWTHYDQDLICTLQTIPEFSLELPLTSAVLTVHRQSDVLLSVDLAPKIEEAKTFEDFAKRTGIQLSQHQLPIAGVFRSSNLVVAAHYKIDHHQVRRFQVRFCSSDHFHYIMKCLRHMGCTLMEIERPAAQIESSRPPTASALPTTKPESPPKRSLSKRKTPSKPRTAATPRRKVTATAAIGSQRDAEASLAPTFQVPSVAQGIPGHSAHAFASSSRPPSRPMTVGALVPAASTGAASIDSAYFGLPPPTPTSRVQPVLQTINEATELSRTGSAIFHDQIPSSSAPAAGQSPVTSRSPLISDVAKRFASTDGFKAADVLPPPRQLPFHRPPSSNKPTSSGHSSAHSRVENHSSSRPVTALPEAIRPPTSHSTSAIPHTRSPLARAMLSVSDSTVELHSTSSKTLQNIPTGRSSNLSSMLQNMEGYKSLSEEERFRLLDEAMEECIKSDEFLQLCEDLERHRSRIELRHITGDRSS